eukprot:gene16544-18804_t
MGCTSANPLPPCEYPSSGFNFRGVDESIDRENGHFHMKCHSNCSWKWTPSTSSEPIKGKESTIYVFPVLSDSIAGISISFNIIAKGSSLRDPVIIKLELMKNDQKTILSSLIATATSTKQQHNVQVKNNTSILQNAERGDVYRLICCNINKNCNIQLSNLSATLSSRNSFSCVRLPFEEIINNQTTLNVLSYRVWELKAIRAPIGWTNTPPLHARPTSIDGLIELEILNVNGEDENGLPASRGGSPDRKKGNGGGNSPAKKTPPPSPTKSVGNSPTKSPAKNSPKKLGTAAPKDLGTIQFSLSLIRGGHTIVLSYIIIDQNRLQFGNNKIEFHINEQLSSALIKSFNIGDYYQIDRYHNNSNIIIKVKKFHLRFHTKEKRSICTAPHRLIRLIPEQQQQLVLTDLSDGEEEVVDVRGKKMRENNEYDSFFYLPSEPSLRDDVDCDPHELHQEIHHGHIRQQRPEAGWGSWEEV